MWNVVALTVIFMVSLLLIFIIWRQPESKTKLSFKVRNALLEAYMDSICSHTHQFLMSATLQVPLLPFIPVISMFVNVYLMMQLDRGTWIRFAIWMVLGKQLSDVLALEALSRLAQEKVFT